MGPGLGRAREGGGGHVPVQVAWPGEPPAAHLVHRVSCLVRARHHAGPQVQVRELLEEALGDGLLRRATGAARAGKLGLLVAPRKEMGAAGGRRRRRRRRSCTLPPWSPRRRPGPTHPRPGVRPGGSAGGQAPPRPPHLLLATERLGERALRPQGRQRQQHHAGQPGRHAARQGLRATRGSPTGARPSRTPSLASSGRRRRDQGRC